MSTEQPILNFNDGPHVGCLLARSRSGVDRRRSRAPWRRQWAWLLVAGIVAVESITTPAGAEDPRRLLTLFDLPGPSKIERARAPGIVRSQSADLRLDDLLAKRPRAGDSIALPLFEDATYTGIVDRVVRRNPRRWTVRGHLDGEPGGRFVLIAEDGIVATNVWLSDGSTYAIRFVPGLGHEIQEIEPIPETFCGVPASPPRAAPEPRTSAPHATAQGAPAPVVIDVLFPYTASARSAAGGTPAIRALIQLMIEIANDAFQNSSIDVLLRMVGRFEIDYDETGATHAQHLDRMSNWIDGFMDDLPGLRDQAGADLVQLIVDDDGTGTLGLGRLGFLLLPHEGFSSIEVDGVFNGLEFGSAHEFGHNFGSGHDSADPEFPNGIYSYSRGHGYMGDTANLRTIMAGLNVPGRVIQNFSNPNVSVEGGPTGVPIGQSGEADNRATFAATAPFISNYLAASPAEAWVDYSAFLPGNGTEILPYQTLQQGIDGVLWGGTVRVKASSGVEPISIDKPVRIEATGGTVTIRGE